YSVNRFNMPLFQVGGVIGLHTNFPIVFALISNEKEESYRWVLETLRDLGQHYGIPPPKVFVTDYDQAFKNAFKAVFLRIKQQLCRWHIIKNVVHNIKRLWRGQLGDFAGGHVENRRI